MNPFTRRRWPKKGKGPYYQVGAHLFMGPGLAKSGQGVRTSLGPDELNLAYRIGFERAKRRFTRAFGLPAVFRRNG